MVDKATKRFVMRFHADRCTFCAQCVVSCNFDAIQLSNERWELAALDRRPFAMILGREAGASTPVKSGEVLAAAGEPPPCDAASPSCAPAPRPARVAILGVGNESNGDDGAGVRVVRELAARMPATPGVLLIDAGTAPENFTGPLRRFRPELVIEIDAAHLGAAPAP